MNTRKYKKKYTHGSLKKGSYVYSFNNIHTQRPGGASEMIPGPD